MKIGVTTWGCDSGRSGIGQYAIQLLTQWSRMNLSHSWSVFGDPQEQAIFLPPDAKMTWISKKGLRHPIPNILWHQLLLPRYTGKLDVLFLPAGNRRLTWYSRCPVIATIHDFSALHVQDKYDSRRMLYIRKVLPMMMRRLDQVITISESSKRDIVEYARVPESKIVIIHQGVNHDFYYPQERSVAKNYVAEKYNLQQPYILYISRLEHPGKNHVRLIQAFELFKQQTGLPHQLVLAGSDWTRADEIHQRVAASTQRDNIRCTGFAAFADLPFLYNGADLFVFPSLYEGFGIPILEAMACGIPTICSNCSSLPEVAGDAALLFDPLQEQQIAETMREVLQNSAKHQELSERGRKRSLQFTWHNTATQTLQIIEKFSR